MVDAGYSGEALGFHASLFSNGPTNESINASAAAKLQLEEDDATPPSFFCPITQEVMVDPVMCADGHTYERHAIERWLQEHRTSPKTNAMLPNSSVRARAVEGQLHAAATCHSLY